MAHFLVLMVVVGILSQDETFLSDILTFFPHTHPSFFVFSKNVKTVQKLSFMVVASGYDATAETNGVSITVPVKRCLYVGLQGLCTAQCGKATALLPTDSPLRDCTDKAVTTGTGESAETTAASLVVYKDYIEANKCDNLPADAGVLTKLTCTNYQTCQTGGNVVMAFAVIGAIGAILSMAIFAWRMNGDGMCAKLISVAFSTATFIACTTAFGGFQSCATDQYNFTKTAYELEAAISTTIKNVEVGVAPGVGGIMAVTSFVFFIYVMLMSLFIPAANAEAEHEAVDSKVQV